MTAAGDVAVVGAGALGLAVAWRLATDGHAVTLLDPAPGSGASGVAAGMLAPVAETRWVERRRLGVLLTSARLWPTFATDLEDASDVSVGLRDDGTLLVACDAGDRALLDALVDEQTELDLPVTRLTRTAARDLEPALSPAVRAGARLDSEASVDPVAVTRALEIAARRADVAFRPLGVDRIETAHGRLSGLTLTDGTTLECHRAVVAAGAWSGQLDGFPDGTVPPVRPVHGQTVTVRSRGPVLTRTVRGWAASSHVYLVPRDDGRIVIGATSEERGFDTGLRTGAVEGLLRDALTLVPGLDETEFVGTRAGLRPATPDGLPLIGPTAVEGLHLATGHFRNGILLTPVTAEAIAAVLSGAPLPEGVTDCDPRRFERALT